MIKLQEKFKGKLKENEPMRLHTTFKIGGPARFFLEVKSSEELIEAVRLAREEGVEWTVIGNGSNLLVSDEGFNGLIIKMLDVRCEMLDETRILAGAGLSLPKLAQFALKNNLSGLEWAAGIPGTVGGAIVMNAGCFRNEMSNIVVKVKYFDSAYKKTIFKKVTVLSNKQCKFGYRESVFHHRPRWIIMEVELKLVSGGRKEIRKKMMGYFKSRRENMPLEFPSAGSIFKKYNISAKKKLNRDLRKILQKEHPEFLNNKYIPAGWLIDMAGLKGKKIGGAAISNKHANFIINSGQSSAKDVLALIDMAKQRIKDRFDLAIDEEVEYLGGLPGRAN